MSEKVMWSRAWRDGFGDVHTTVDFSTEEEANNQPIDASNAWCGPAFSFKVRDLKNEQ